MNVGEYLALSGDKINGVEMIATRLATHYTLKEVCFRDRSLFIFMRLICFPVSFFSQDKSGDSLFQKLTWIEERLSSLMTDDPTVIETSLAQYGDVVYPESKSVLFK